MSKRVTRSYTEDFKRKAVALRYENGSVKRTSQELGIAVSVLGRWCKEAKEYGLNSFPGKGKPKLTDTEKKVVELQKQLQDSQLENEILKKAISIFSKSDKISIGS